MRCGGTGAIKAFVFIGTFQPAGEIDSRAYGGAPHLLLRAHRAESLYMRMPPRTGAEEANHAASL
jgi:hypothetical protein